MIEIDLDAEELACLGMRLVPDPADPWANLVPEGLKQDLPAACFPAPKRARRVSIRQIEKETGRVVTAVTVSPDGSRTYALADAAENPAPDDEVEAWIKKQQHAH